MRNAAGEPFFDKQIKQQEDSVAEVGPTLEFQRLPARAQTKNGGCRVVLFSCPSREGRSPR